MNYEPMQMSSCGVAEDYMNATANGEWAGRSVDTLLAACALLFLAPLLVVVAAMIYILDPGPIFFGHRRLGRDGRTFRCWKFRTHGRRLGRPPGAIAGGQPAGTRGVGARSQAAP